jgi:hypothetical protein
MARAWVLFRALQIDGRGTAVLLLLDLEANALALVEVP